MNVTMSGIVWGKTNLQHNIQREENTPATPRAPTGASETLLKPGAAPRFPISRRLPGKATPFPFSKGKASAIVGELGTPAVIL